MHATVQTSRWCSYATESSITHGKHPTIMRLTHQPGLEMINPVGILTGSFLYFLQMPNGLTNSHRDSLADFGALFRRCWNTCCDHKLAIQKSSWTLYWMSSMIGCNRARTKLLIEGIQGTEKEEEDMLTSSREIEEEKQLWQLRTATWLPIYSILA